MQLFPIIADNWQIDGGVAYGVVPRSLWSRWHVPDDNNMIAITNRCLLVVDNERKILIDTGFGDKRDEKYYAIRYREAGINLVTSLQNAGFQPDDITDVLFTHLHDDHVGGAVMHNNAGYPEHIFRNAFYWVSESQWQWALQPNKREAAAYFNENLEPLHHSGRLRLVRSGDQPFHNITVRIYNGHTRGQLIPLIHTPDRTVVYMGDFIPTVSMIPLPYIASVDIEPLVTLHEKELFLDEAAAQDFTLFFEHDATNECCSVVKTSRRVEVNKTFQLNME